MSNRLAPAGWRGTDGHGRHQCLTCWGWKFPALHSCPGTPNRLDRTPPPTPQRIERRRTTGWRMPADAVYVGRPTKFGNPYAVVRIRWDGSRVKWYVRDCRQEQVGGGYYDTQAEAAERAVALYRQWCWVIEADVRHELAGRDLVCWCPLVDAAGVAVPCHADVLLELANPQHTERCHQ